MQYDNTNKVVIFKNNKKEKETQPDYTGTVNLNGIDFSVSLWIREGKSGKFFAGSIQEPFKKMENFSDKVNKKNDSDDIPF